MMTILTARPEAITFDPQQTALIVVDMQNAYATPGGYRRDRGTSSRDADHLVSKWLG
mgnify:CR=1 FL=1